MVEEPTILDGSNESFLYALVLALPSGSRAAHNIADNMHPFAV